MQVRKGTEAMNNFKLEIYDYKEKKYIEYPTAVFPFKFSQLLDERLDEAQLMLKRVKTEYFAPFTDVRLTIINSPKAMFSSAQAVENRAETQCQIQYNEHTKRITETLVLNFIVANDKAVESPIGSGKFNHELYLIETTKKLEAYIGDSITFTNPLGNDYLGASETVNDDDELSISLFSNPEGATFKNENGETVTAVSLFNNDIETSFTVIIPDGYKLDKIVKNPDKFYDLKLLSQSGNEYTYQATLIEPVIPDEYDIAYVAILFYISQNA